MKLTIKLTGLKEFIAKLIRKKQSIKRNLEVALDNIGKMVVEKAREYVPEDSGQLKSDIEYKVGRNFVDIGVPRSAKSGAYAYFIHYGRYKEGDKTMAKNGGRMFISNAIRDLDREIKRELGYVLGN